MKKGLGWPIGLTVILLATVVGNIGVIVLTKDDPSFAVEPDYYRKAVEWDSTQASQARSDALAWAVSARIASQSDGAAELVLALTDAAGVAVPNAEVRGSLLHIARAAEVQEVSFAATADGHYAATVPMARAGVWELRLTASRQSAAGDAEHFVHTIRLDTEQPGGVPAGAVVGAGARVAPPLGP